MAQHPGVPAGLVAKKSLCKTVFKERGTCRYGTRCPDAHSVADISGFRTRPCPYFQEGRCKNGDLCTFWHEDRALKGRQCAEFGDSGSCRFGDKCFYEHERGAGPTRRVVAAAAPPPDRPKPPPPGGKAWAVARAPPDGGGAAAAAAAVGPARDQAAAAAAAGPPPPHPARAEALPWLDAFEHLEAATAEWARGAAGTGQRISLPVWCLRWTHDGIHSNMVFGDGRAQDKSVYEMVQDLFSKRLDPTSDKLPPLQVVLDGGRLYSISNRRLAALKMYQSLRQHEVVTAPCQVYLADDERIRAKYAAAKTTGPDLRDGLGVEPHSAGQEAWHMGSALFRHRNEFLANREREDGGAAQPSTAASAVRPVEVNFEPVAKPPPPPPGPPPRTAAPSGIDAAVPRQKPAALPPVAVDLAQAAKAPPKAGGLPVKWPAPPPMPVQASLPVQGGGGASAPNGAGLGGSSPPPSPKASPSQPPDQMVVAPDGADALLAFRAAIVAVEEAEDWAGAAVAEALRGPCRCPQVRNVLAAYGWRDDGRFDGPPNRESLLRALRAAQQLAVPQSVAEDDEGLGAPRSAPPLEPPSVQAEGDEDDAFGGAMDDGDGGEALRPTGAEAFRWAIIIVESIWKSEREWDAGTAGDLFQQLCAGSELLSATLKFHGWDGVDFRGTPDWGQLLRDLESAQADCATASEGGGLQYEDEAALRAAMGTQGDVKEIDSLRDKVVFGIFRCTSGSDFRGRRSRGELVVEQGPKALLGCRVHIIGQLCRNRAWHFDHCFVRILEAKVAQGSGATVQDKWDSAATEKTALYGKVVLAQPSPAPRQEKVLCLRSKVVRNMCYMQFRAMNGKFPLITVPWNNPHDPPDLLDMHVVEVKQPWKAELPMGRYVETLSEQSMNDSILGAVKISLNFCDWGDRTGKTEEWPQGAVDPVADARRKDYRQRFAATVCIEHKGWPASFAMSLPKEGSFVYFHVVDVNAYLDSAKACQIESTLRERAVGAWVLDYLDDPMPECLPLFPPEMGQAPGFQEGVPTLAVTFEFRVDPRTGTVDFLSGKHYESIVECSHHYTFQEAGQVLLKSESEATRDCPILHRLLKHAKKLASELIEQGRVDVFEHLEHDFANLQARADQEEEMRRSWTCHKDWPGRLLASEVVAACAYMVNRYAGLVLADADCWRHLFHPEPEAQTVMPQYSRVKADPIAVRGALRLLMQTGAEPPAPGGPVRTEHMVKALQHVLGKSQLSKTQAQCLQAAFLKQLSKCLPFSFYRVTGAPSKRVTAAQEAKRVVAAQEASLYRRDTLLFHVTSPLRRYLDLLGMRALKAKEGWRPTNSELLLTPKRLEEAVSRTNMRQDAAHFAAMIYRQISVTREFEQGGWRVHNAIVSSVMPSCVEVIVPLPAKAGLPLSLPVSALRGASCTVEFLSQEQALKVVCYQAEELVQSQRGEWKVQSWGATTLSCVVARNFAQPLRHNASISSVALSDITFRARVGIAGTVDLTLGVGHRMCPEVFSTWPDLTEWRNVDRDISAYSNVWHAIRLCETHAAAALSPVYTNRTNPQRLSWYGREGQSKGKYCLCKLTKSQLRYGDRIVDAEDVAIIRCSSTDLEREFVLYGTVVKCKRSETQQFTRMCTRNDCDRVACQYAHSEEELRGLRYEVEIKLSTVSAHAKSTYDAYGSLFEGPGTAVELQFINVPLADRRSLAKLKKIPDEARGDAPVIPFLVSVRSADTRRRQEERRALVEAAQVEAAMRYPYFTVPADKPQLNPQQQLAVMEAMQKEFTVVQGPPGTGKTTFLVHLVVALLNLEANTEYDAEEFRMAGRPGTSAQRQQVGKILICAPSNQAANEVLSRLQRDTTIPVDYIVRVYARSIEASDGSKYKGGLHIGGQEDFQIASSLKEYSLHSRTHSRPELSRRRARWSTQQDYDEAYEREETAVLKQARVVVTTCTSACGHSSLTREKTRFATVIIDEAAQATEPDVVLPAMLAKQRVVLVGDHQQLGPVITEGNLCRAYLGALERPMIERLYKTPHLRPPSTMLETQYRMHGSIRSFPSHQFYSGQLKDADSIQEQRLCASIWPKAADGQHVVFVDCTKPHKIGSVTEVGLGRSRGNTTIENNTSLQNEGEAKLVALACDRLLHDLKCRPDQVAVLTPYRAQQDEIRNLLGNRLGREGKDITVGTVYALQGSERDYIILSLVRSVAEGVALNQNVYATGPDDIVVRGNSDLAALRQICESHLGIVGNCKLLNVSLTRAKSGLVIIGNQGVLKEGSEDFLGLITHLAERECVLSEQAFKNLQVGA